MNKKLYMLTSIVFAHAYPSTSLSIKKDTMACLSNIVMT